MHIRIKRAEIMVKKCYPQFLGKKWQHVIPQLEKIVAAELNAKEVKAWRKPNSMDVACIEVVYS